MKKRNLSLKKITILSTLILFGLGGIDAVETDLEKKAVLESSEQGSESQELEDQNIEHNLNKFEGQEDPESPMTEEDPFFTTLFDEVLSEIDDDDFEFEDWEVALLDYSDEPDKSHPIDAAAEAPANDTPKDIDLLPLNDIVYNNVSRPSSWTRQVKVKTAQYPVKQPVVIGSRSYEDVLKEQKETGIRILTKRPTLEGGVAEVASQEAALKDKEVREALTYGIAPQEQENQNQPEAIEPDTPFTADDLDEKLRSQIFSSIESPLAAEPFRVAQEDEIEPFDQASLDVNALVLDHHLAKAHETELLAQAAPPSIQPEEQSKKQQDSTPQTWIKQPKNNQAQTTQSPSNEQPAQKAQADQPQDTQVDQTQNTQADQAQVDKLQDTQDDQTQEIKVNKAKDEVIEEAPEKPAGPPEFLIKFNNVKMSEYINFVSKITGKNFVFDPADLNFNVTIVSNEPTTLENIISALLQELRFRGLSMVEVGNNIIIHQQLGINAPAKVIPEGEAPPEDIEIVTQVYRIQNTDPSTIATIIRPMLSANALIEPISDSGHLIVTGLRTNIARITELIASIDSPDAGLEIGQYQSQHLPISRAITIAKELISPIAKDRPIVLTALSDKNVVYIVTTPSLMAQVIKIFERIDQNDELPATRFDLNARGKPIFREEFVKEGERRQQAEIQKKLEEERNRIAASGPFGSVEATKFYIHKLQYRKGDEIQNALQAVATSLENIAAEAENNDLIATINSVQWIESSNSLIFTGTTATLQKMKELVDELDTALPQVLIEVLVLEATVDDALEFGVDWGSRFRDLNVAGSQAFLQDSSSLPAALDSTIPTETLNPNNISRTAGFNIGVIGRIITRGSCDFTSLGAVVRAIHTDRRIDVLLNPRIVVEDNAPAEFFVGINTPFLTQSIANEFGNVITGNFEYRDVGSTLKITPLIGNNGIITLDIEQEISSPVASNSFLSGVTAGTNSSTINADGTVVTVDNSGQQATDIGPTTRKSTTKTRVHMPDGYFLILSGQIRDEKEVTRTQIPCIGGIPWLGAFFSAQSNRIDKKNLMIFIRPQIVDVERINPITKRQQDQWDEAKREHKRWNYEVDEALEWFNVKDSYCAPEERRIRE